ncbi:DUF2510 domain-containing protein [Mycobacterium sp. 852002-51961_SCH5331710]|uniref:DUF2510 domain-containing protein n=1 Tax=Mycobacterium sp. 852002-51961_SCH5331710 TaxID=1834105 RepID=UPI0007FE5472|nr:DUF2510 domain-containing protein [Mycobacterium sp. 852002-51961_SCH5331710]OBB35896.1 hypothetical protein A5752_17650 [Mycobacterium sp. 852002-51961_SCH5331710]
MTTPPTPAGWYPDPNGTGGQRYWDGSTWTEQRSPDLGSQPAPPPSAPDNRRLLTGYLAACGALLLVLIAAVVYGVYLNDADDTADTAASTSSTETTTAATTTAADQAEAAEVPTPDVLPPAGAATVDGALAFTLVDVETGTTVSSTEAPVEKTATGEYVVVRLSVVNNSDATAQFLGTLQKLHAADTVYNIDDEATFYVGGGFVEIPSGAEAQVGLAYDVPPGTVPDFVEVHADPLSAGVQVPLS